MQRWLAGCLAIFLSAYTFLGMVTQAMAAPSDFVQASGATLTYRGETIKLLGTNFDNVPALGANIGSGDIDDIQITEADYETLKANGGNHTRLGLSFNWYQDNPTQFFSVIDQHIEWARTHNVWIVLNLFTTPADCYEGYSEVCDIWTDPTEQQEFEDFWIDVAEHYYNEPVIAGYGLLNEPNPQGPNYCSTWFDLASQVRDEVYAIAPNQLVFVSACSDPGNSLRFRNPPFGTNIVYEVHDYFPTQLSTNSALTYPGQATDWFGTCTYNKNAFLGIQQSGDPAGCGAHTDLETLFGVDWASSNSVPLYFGEWGSTSSLNGYVQFHQDKAEILNTWGVSSAHYTWKHRTIVTGGSNQWGIYANPLRLDDPLKLGAVQTSWTDAVFPDFAATTPELTVTPLSPDPSTNATPSWSGSGFAGNDTVQSIEYQLDSTAGAWTSCTADDGAFDEQTEAFTCTAGTIADGAHTLNIRVTNTSAMTASVADSFVIDTTAPSLSVTPLSPDPTTDRSPTLTGSTTDATSTIAAVQYQIGGTLDDWSSCTADDGAFDEATEAFSCTVSPDLNPSPHVIYIRSTDTLGLAATPVSDSFTLDSTLIWQQTDWSGGSGQAAYIDLTRFNSSTGFNFGSVGDLTLNATAVTPWYNQDWDYRKKITIDHQQVSGSSDLTNFPVLINLTADAQLAQFAMSNGYDILFTSSDGVTKLSHEIEKYVTATGEIQVWVKIPTLSTSTNTEIYMYYGNDAAANQQDAAGVWSANFNGVWHLSQDPSATAPQFLSSVGSGHGTGSGLVSGDQQPAQIDGGIDFTSTGDYIQIPDSSAMRPTGAMTISSWVNINSYASSGRIFAKIAGSTSRAWSLNVEGSDNSIQFAIAPTNSTLQWVNSLDHPATGTWVYAVGVYEPGVALRVYVNGVLSNSNTTSIAASQFSNNAWGPRIGLRVDNSLDFNGQIDEVRLISAARNADWIATEYANQANPDTFYALDSQQARVQYTSSATLLSSIFDSLGATIWGTLSLNQTVPSNTATAVKVRTSNSSSMTGAPDFDSCSPVSTGSDLSENDCVQDSDRYAQYQLTSTSSDPFITPTFSLFSVGYTLENTLPSLSLNALSSPVVSPFNLTGTAQDADGTIAAVEYQANATAGSWSACSANDTIFNEASEAFRCAISLDQDGTVYVRAQDQTGDYSEISSAQVVLGGTATIQTPSTPSTVVTTPGCTATPPGSKVPWLYGAIATSSTSIQLYFTPADEPVNHYVIQFGTESGKYLYASGELTASNRVLEVSHLSPGTEYFFTIRGGHDCAPGGWSNELAARTKAGNFFATLPATLNSSFNLDPESTQPLEPTFSEVTAPTEDLSLSDSTGGSQPAPGKESAQVLKTGHTVKIAVKDPAGQPVVGAEVELHSDPKYGSTDQAGEVSFNEVESGQHRLLVTHDGMTAEQSLFINENTQTVELNITLQPPNRYREYGLAVVCVVLLGLVGLLLLRRR